MAREVEAKIASILSDSSIAINAGAERGVSVGDNVTVWRDVAVKDPDTGDDLGSVRLQALRLRITQVQPRLAVAHVVNKTLDPLAGIFGPSKVIASSSRGSDSNVVRLSAGNVVTITLENAEQDAFQEDGAASDVSSVAEEEMPE